MSTLVETYLSYPRGVAENTETFSDRLARLVSEAGLSDTEVASVLGVSENQARRTMDGATVSLKLIPALRLCRKLGVSPWVLAGELEPTRLEADAERVESSPDLRAEVKRLSEAFEKVQKRVEGIAQQMKLDDEAVTAHRSRPKSPKGKQKPPRTA
jgi:transcriptional regulator with XRE-family HTH domain